jgi:hypothetical protein
MKPNFRERRTRKELEEVLKGQLKKSLRASASGLELQSAQEKLEAAEQ